MSKKFLLLKIGVFINKKKFYRFSIRDENRNGCWVNEEKLLDIKNKSTVNLIIQNKNEIKNYNDEIKEKQIKKKKYNVYKNNVIIRNYIIIIIRCIIISYIFCQIKSNIYAQFYFHFSKITLKTKGIGEYNILGNESNYKFRKINSLKEIKINGEIKNEIDY